MCLPKVTSSSLEANREIFCLARRWNAFFSATVSSGVRIVGAGRDWSVVSTRALAGNAFWTGYVSMGGVVTGGLP